MVSLHARLQKVKTEYNRSIPPEAILDSCQTAGHQFRQRQCGPVQTLYLFLCQVLHGNIACNALRHLATLPCTVRGYCEARARLPLAVFRAVVMWLCQSLRTIAEDGRRWHGHRVFHVDGSSFSMPDTPALQKAFGQPAGQKAGCGFPTAHLLAMFDAATGLIVDVLAAPLRTHEMSQVAAMHPHLQAGDVLVGDRGFCSYAHLALLWLRNLHGLFRVHQRMIVDFRPHRPHAHPSDANAPPGLPRSRWLRCIGRRDQIVEYFRPARRPRWMSRPQWEALPTSLQVRELHYRIEVPGYRTQNILLVTTLLDGYEYPAADLAELYRRRWQVEVNLRHLKQTMGMDVLRCKSRDGVLKELLVFAMVYNLVCAVVCEAAVRQDVPPDRISFIDALRWLRVWQPGKALIGLIVNPQRTGRVEPRVVKRRPKQYKLMTEPRHVLRNRLLDKQDTS